MSELTKRLSAYGADMEGAMERMVDDEEMYAECFAMFLDDPAFGELKEALDRQDYEAAFDAAHALKGVSAGLGLTPLYDRICEIVEPLRHHDYSALDAQYQAIAKALEEVKSLQ
jgi:HPt (histidine-containing phosphotransfer) domain-containing protein